MDDCLEKQYKIAIDLGTTTIELAVIDSNGDVVVGNYLKNPQSLYGKDVITRINTAIRDKAYIKIMKDMLLKSLNVSIMSVLCEKSIDYQSINAICICGNTTMISILLEYDLEELGHYPFKHRLGKSVTIQSNEMFDSEFPISCDIILSGCASAFIGGDVLSGLIYINKVFDIPKDKAYLFLDLGTNGEMVLYNNNEYFTTSAACGPAFESLSRCTNIYGSSLIDSITMGIKAGRISKDGILEDDLIETGIDIMGVHITAEILRDILMAKAAIRTGIDILLDEAAIDASDLKDIFIAGGFGFYLNIDNAMFIGLIPHILSDKINIVGNSSLKGAIEILNKPENIKFINNFNINKVKNIQMSNLPDYQDRLINNIHFKQ